MAATLEGAVEPAEIIVALRRYGVTQHDIARVANVSDRAVHDWTRAGGIHDHSYDRLTNIRDVVLELRGSLTDRGVRQWLQARNRTLGGRRPLEVLAAGDAEAVKRASKAFAEGVYV